MQQQKKTIYKLLGITYGKKNSESLKLHTCIEQNIYTHFLLLFFMLDWVYSVLVWVWRTNTYCGAPYCIGLVCV